MIHTSHWLIAKRWPAEVFRVFKLSMEALGRLEELHRLCREHHRWPIHATTEVLPEFLNAADELVTQLYLALPGIEHALFAAGPRSFGAITSNSGPHMAAELLLSAVWDDFRELMLLTLIRKHQEPDPLNHSLRVCPEFLHYVESLEAAGSQDLGPVKHYVFHDCLAAADAVGKTQPGDETPAGDAAGEWSEDPLHATRKEMAEAMQVSEKGLDNRVDKGFIKKERASKGFLWRFKKAEFKVQEKRLAQLRAAGS